MTGNELKAFRSWMGIKQNDFYFGIGFFPSNGNSVEKNYGKNQIPSKLQAAVEKKYKKQLHLLEVK